jgi:hypothetical protein
LETACPQANAARGRAGSKDYRIPCATDWFSVMVQRSNAGSNDKTTPSPGRGERGLLPSLSGLDTKCIHSNPALKRWAIVSMSLRFQLSNFACAEIGQENFRQTN